MSNEVSQILEDRLIAEWNARTPITWDETGRKPTVGVDFIRCTLDEIDAETISIGCTREYHLFTIQVFTKADKGRSDSMTLTAELKRIFSSYAHLTLLCTKAIDQRVGSFDSFYQRNVLIDVQYDNHIN